MSDLQFFQTRSGEQFFRTLQRSAEVAAAQLTRLADQQVAILEKLPAPTAEVAELHKEIHRLRAQLSLCREYEDTVNLSVVVSTEAGITFYPHNVEGALGYRVVHANGKEEFVMLHPATNVSDGGVDIAIRMGADPVGLFAGKVFVAL